MGLKFQSILYKTTGVMFRKLRMKTCEDFGKTLIQDATNVGSLNAEKASKLLSNALKSKDKNRILFTNNIEEAREFCKQKKIYFDDSSFRLFKTGHAITFTDLQTKLILFPESCNYKNQAGLIAHEFQHALYHTNSPQYLFAKFINKFRSKNNTEKLIEQFQPLMPERYRSLYSKAMSSDNPYAYEYFQKAIRQNVLIPGESKLNYSILSFLKKLMRDEARSYEISYKVSGDSNMKTISDSFNTLADTLNKEKRLQLYNRIKEFFKLKPKDYSIPPEPISFVVKKGAAPNGIKVKFFDKTI